MISSKMSLHAFWSVPVKVWNSYQKSTIAEAVQINEEKEEMEKPHFLAQDPDHGMWKILLHGLHR